MSFVFYDIETTGLDASFDQIVSFAAIRTDNELEIIDTFEAECRLLPYVIPSPEAILVNRIGINRLTDSRLPSHYEMACHIQQKLSSWSPTIFIGHNSISFDENFLRQLFYQNLLPPYLTNTNSNTRADCIRMVQAASLIAPDTINIPSISDKQRFNLKELAESNGHHTESAHSALHDTLSIIHLCRILYEHAPDVWSNSVRFSQKSAVKDFVHSEDVYCLSVYKDGIPYCYLVTTIGNNPKDNNELLAFNLCFDPSSIADRPDDEIRDLIKSEPRLLVPFRSNANPIIFPNYDAPEISNPGNLSDQELNRRASRIKNDENLSERLVKIFFSTRPDWESSTHVERQIYDKFFSRDDEAITAKFHKTPWDSRQRLLERLSDERLKELGLRILYTEHPEILPQEISNQYHIYAARRVLGFGENVPWLSAPEALVKTKSLLGQSNTEDKEILSGLQYYYEKIVTQASERLNKLLT